MTLLLTAEQHLDMAQRLYEAKRTGCGIVPPSEEIDYTLDDAYRVRRLLVDLMLADGRTTKGHKIGFTSEAMQKMYGMTGPDFGQLLDDVFVAVGQPVPASTLADARVEAEIAFVLRAPLRGPDVTVADVLAATDVVCAAIEVIDSRVGAMRAKAVDSIADNAGAGKVVLSDLRVAPTSLDLTTIPIEMAVDAESHRGMSGDVMGNPAAAVAWLANKLADIDGLGGQLEAGDIVMSGSAVRSVAVNNGSRLSASFGPLGTIDIEFT
ncbi:MAG: 2-oxo-hepta-3-ene,7-dioic acid hydratase [Actinomycetota bacterium]